MKVGDNGSSDTVECTAITHMSSFVYFVGQTQLLDIDSPTSSNLFVAKAQASTLTLVWAVGWGGLDLNEIANDLHVTQDEGYVYAAGHSFKFTQDAGGDENPVLAKFSGSDGSHVWSYGIGGTNAGRLTGVSGPRSDTHVVAVGYSTIWGDGTNDRAFAMSVSNTGTLQWHMKHGVDAQVW